MMRIMVIAATLVALSGCAPNDGEPLRVGDPFPTAGAFQTHGAPNLVWIVRPEDYLACQTSAGGLRKLQRRFGATLPLEVIHVGPRPEWFDDFLRRERIAARVTRMEERAYRRSFQSRPAGALLLIEDGTVVKILALPLDDETAEGLIGQLEQSLAVAGGEALSAFRGGRTTSLHQQEMTE